MSHVYEYDVTNGPGPRVFAWSGVAMALMLLCCLTLVEAWLGPPTSFRRHINARGSPVLLQTPSAVMAPFASAIAEFSETAAITAANSVVSSSIDLPLDVSADPVEVTYIQTTATAADSEPPVILLHSFDSSCLEFRRVMPLLEDAAVEAYAVDILGWGFIGTRGTVRSVSVEAKRACLYAFWKQRLGGRPAVFAGSSLGAATIIDFAAAYPDAVRGVVLIDPQGLIDGVPPVPEPLARPGVELLRSWPLRWFGQLVAYQDVPRCATDDAIRVGRLHTSREGWDDDAVDWLLGGGYSVSALVPTLADTPCVLLWGRQDRVLPPAEYLPRFRQALPRSTFRWVEDCGHVPHLEQPAAVAAAIQAAVRAIATDSEVVLAGDGDVGAFGASPSGSSGSPLAKLGEFLDTPILDTGVRGGPLEPFKRFARINPELAQTVASVAAITFFVLIGRALLFLVTGV